MTGAVESVSKLLDAGAPVWASYKKGRQCLPVACLNGRIDVVKLLLERGADVSGRHARFKYNFISS